MSFVITVQIKEGIVMAADSRLTLTRSESDPGGNTILTQVPISDANTKLFCTEAGIGISTFGAASVDDEPLAGHIEEFIRQEANSESATPNDVGKGLCDYFNKMKTPPDTGFHVSGYTIDAGKSIPEVWRCTVLGSVCAQTRPSDQCGASSNGDTGLMGRIFTEVFVKTSDDKFESMGNPQIPFVYFTLQDAIDFAFFATRSTIDFTRFQPVSQTVGGPIDVLVIRPVGHSWVAKKELTVPYIESSS